MNVKGLNHFTLRCDGEQLEPLRDFYSSVLGLTAGPRPTLKFDGYWLYAEGHAIVHLYASGNAPSPEHTALDHISFTARGLESTRLELVAKGIPFTEAPVPGFRLHQLFLRDPNGLKLELTFDLGAIGEVLT